MDVLSHALWGYAVLRWRGPRTARWGALMGAAPDVLYVLIDRTRRALTHGLDSLMPAAGRDPMVWRRDGPPMPQELLDAYYGAYVYTHSLVVLALLALAWWVLRRRRPWLLLPWLVHILMDIPTHERYLTPFLFPVSWWTVEGYAWSRPPVLLVNWGALAATYAVLFVKYWAPRRAARLRPWPEEQAGVA